MKIAWIFLVSMKNMGGAEVFILNILSKLAEFKQNITLYLTDTAYKEMRSNLNNCPFDIKPLGYQTRRMASYAPFFVKQLLKHIQQRERYDLWQVVGAYPAGYIVSSLSGKVPLVLRTHGEDIQKSHELNYGIRLNPIIEKKIQRTVNSMDKVISMTKNMFDCYRDLQVPPGNIVEIPNAVNLKRFDLLSNKLEARKRYNISYDTTLLVTVGRCHRKKGYDLIPGIADSLRKKYSNFKWLLVGNGLEKLRDEIKQKELSDYIILKDQIGMHNVIDKNGEIKIPKDELIRLLKCSDIFVFPTRLEGFPMVLIEAMAAGLPVVTTNSPGVREVVIHNKTALLSEIDDVDSMTSNIIKLIKNNNLRKKLIRESRKELPKYDLSNIANQYLELYTQLVQRKSDRHERKITQLHGK